MLEGEEEGWVEGDEVGIGTAETLGDPDGELEGPRSQTSSDVGPEEGALLKTLG